MVVPIFGVVPLERPVLLVWSELTFFSLLKAHLFSKALKDNSATRILCDNEIKNHHFKIDINIASVLTCSTF